MVRKGANDGKGWMKIPSYTPRYRDREGGRDRRERAGDRQIK